MNDRTETLLREHLRSVDAATLPLTATVGDDISRVERRIARRCRGLAATSAIALVGLAAGVVWNTSASPQQITGADGVPSTTALQVVPTTSAVGTGLWSPIPRYRKPTTGTTVVWTGTEALMIGGHYPDGTVAGIDVYNPSTSQWRTVSGASTLNGDALELADNAIAFWSGTALVLVTPLSVISRIDLVDDTGFRTQVVDAAAIDAGVPWVWTGSELLVWPTAVEVLPARSPRAFDPETFEWRVLAEPPIEARKDAASIWTGTEWLVWGGNGASTFADGAAYNPVTDTWRVLSESPLLPRSDAKAVWTGSEMIVTPGGAPDGAAYDPVADTWRRIAPGFGHPGFEPVWTGSLVVLFAKGGAVWYDPLTDQWSTGDMDFGDVAHLDQFPVWTGEVVLLMGSHDSSTGGASFTPPQP